MKYNENPAVSIVITCFNYGKYLEEAITSCLNSTFKDIEILVVNDGSTDEKTISILHSIVSPNIYVIHQENKGLPAARNIGIRAARGKYILPLDADDIIHPKLIEKAYDLLEEHIELGFVSHWTKAFGDEDYIWAVPPFDKETLLKRNIVCGTSLFRKKAWEDAGGYNETMIEGFEDWDFWISVIENGWEGYTLPEVLFYYRRHGNTMLETAIPKFDRLYETIKNNHPYLFEMRGV